MLSADARRRLLRNGGFHTFLYVLPVVLLLVAMTGLRFNSRLRVVQENNTELAQATAVSFRNYLNHVWDTEKALGEAIVETAPPGEVITRLLTRQLSTCPSVRNLVYLDAGGNARAASNPQVVGASFLDRGYVQALIHGQEMVVSDLVVGRVSGQATLMVGRAIRRGPALRALIIATIDVTRLAEALPSRAGQGNVGLVDANGRLVYQSRYPQLPWEKRILASTSPAWKALKGQAATSTRIRSDSGGSILVGAAVPIPEVGWAAIASVARSKALAPAYREALFSLFGGLLVIGATLLGVVLFRNEAVRRFAALSQAAASFAEGHYEARVDVPVPDQLSGAETAFNRMAERIQELEQERLRFIQLTAHELRTPLTSVRGICNLLTRQMASDPQTARLAEILQAEIGHLSGLVDDVLGAFLHQEGRIVLSFQPLDLAEVVRGALQPFAAAEPERFLLQAEQSPLAVSGDLRRLHQVFKNILSNSIKYSAPGTPVEITLSSDGASAVATVKDWGRGIPQSQLHMVFDPFFRASNVDDTFNQSGIGLGLHLCQVVIERHGGRIWVESEEGVGSTFFVSLPLMKSDGPGEG